MFLMTPSSSTSNPLFVTYQIIQIKQLRVNDSLTGSSVLIIVWESNYQKFTLTKQLTEQF